MFRSARVLGSVLGAALLTGAAPSNPPATISRASTPTATASSSFAILPNSRQHTTSPATTWARLAREWRTTTPTSLLPKQVRGSGSFSETFQILHSGTYIYPGEWCGYVVTAFYEGRTFVWKLNGVQWSTGQSINFTAPSHGNTAYVEVWEYDGSTNTNYADLMLYSDQYNAPQPPSTSCYPV